MNAGNNGIFMQDFISWYFEKIAKLYEKNILYLTYKNFYKLVLIQNSILYGRII